MPITYLGSLGRPDHSGTWVPECPFSVPSITASPGMEEAAARPGPLVYILGEGLADLVL